MASVTLQPSSKSEGAAVAPVVQLENAIRAELVLRALGKRDPLCITERYEVRNVIGRGASAVVVLAFDERLDRHVVLKLRPSGSNAPLEEARKLASLEHPNIMRVLDAFRCSVELGEERFHLWAISMPKLEGETMRRWMAEKRSTKEILAVVLDVARGLAAAHSQALLLHRDVKPDNIFVLESGSAQVLDFGIAARTPTTSGMPGSLGPAGTEPYMAPEVWTGRSGRRSDQYSLGITLVEALTGVPEQAGWWPPAGVRWHVWRIARRATASKPEARYSDMNEFVEALERALDREKQTSTASAWLGRIYHSGIGAMTVGFLVWTATRADWSSLGEWMTLRESLGSFASGASEAAERPTGPRQEELIDSSAASGATAPTGYEVEGNGFDVGTRGRFAAEGLEDPSTTPTGVDMPRGEPDLDGGMTGRPAEPSCAFVGSATPRRFEFCARRTYGGDLRRPPTGRYVLQLGADQGRLSIRRLERIRPGGDVLDLERVDIRSEERCAIHVVAWAEHRSRRYEFWMDLEGEEVTGRFEATRDQTQPDYGGELVPKPACEPFFGSDRTGRR